MKNIVTKNDLVYCYPMHKQELPFLKECTSDDIDNWYALPSSHILEETTGCTYHMVETLEDLNQIQNLLPGKTTKGHFEYGSILNNVLEFDSMEMSDDKSHMIIFSGIHDGGGPVWYIPRRIMDQCPNVMDSFLATRAYWDNSTKEFMR
jgi:hypothetical protein